MEKAFCSICGKECISDGCGTGYGVNPKGEKICYSCCGELDKQKLKNLPFGEKMILYLVSNPRYIRSTCGITTMPSHYVMNWPGTFKIAIWRVKNGRHNIASRRYDFWFDYDGKHYHGTQYGDFTQIAHIYRIKNKS